ncbi:ferrous iron transporter B [Uliginosibacterium sediminicola]|uniref:Ferrous iron transport protein B n=1 Tax=Uliginosibacterium sediminicola TaxID=2024550 RepID=A0ABU9Z283_9RHOO
MSTANPVLHAALLGNPNCGKTALFNRLTGSRQKVANYAGVTVERKEGQLQLPSGRSLRLLDLPGAYSLTATSPDEAVTRDVVMGARSDEARPDLLICVVDATNLRLHLRFVLELARLGLPMLVSLNMMDAAQKRGIRIDREKLQSLLGMPVVETIAVRKDGAAGLLAALDGQWPPAPQALPADADLHEAVQGLLNAAVSVPRRTAEIDDALDRWTLHPVIGMLILAAVMFLMFQAVFSWAGPFQDGIEAAVAASGTLVGDLLPDGMLKSLLVDGVIAGVGSVLVFLPQILLLFLFILCLEESGYLPRAAFLLDRLMLASGLSGRAFIPLLSSFACAIPGIMATRSIQHPRDRLLTIMVAPLMTCSARLPVYALLIGAFVPDRTVLGVFGLQGLVLFGLYMAGIVTALAVAWVVKRFGSGHADVALLMELPSWRLPNWRDIGIGLMERASIFLKRVGGIILALSVLLWFLASFPAPPADWHGTAIEYSFAGHIGRAMQVIFAPVGFNWQICVALIPGLAAREVAVSGLATVYAIGSTADAEAALAPLIASQWSLGTALALMAWYIYAPQCLSTLAVMRRETGSWRPVGIALVYLFGLAWLAAFIANRIGILLS